VLVHPESIVHALVGFADGGLMAHVGPPDMRHAIGYALNWPERRALPVERLDLAQVGQLTFRAPDDRRYPALRLAREVMARGGLCGAAFNAAKETALDGFIAGHIGFLQMAEVVEETLTRLSSEPGRIDAAFSLDNVVTLDALARATARDIISERAA
jgi:1-deoxy-D-xylulose-5-phosphate reductoisomerase